MKTDEQKAAKRAYDVKREADPRVKARKLLAQRRRRAALTPEEEKAFLAEKTLKEKMRLAAMTPAQNQVGEVRIGDKIGTLNTNANANASGRNTPMIQQESSVRRLLPIETERLQGFEDNYTLIPWRGKLAVDGVRYKSHGNSMAVPC